MDVYGHQTNLGCKHCGRGPLRWVSSIFGLGLTWEVMGCVADDFPVKDGLKVGLHLSCMAKSGKSQHDKERLSFAHGQLGGWGPPHAERASHSDQPVETVAVLSITPTQARPIRTQHFPNVLVDLGLTGPSLLSKLRPHTGMGPPQAPGSSRGC